MALLFSLVLGSWSWLLWLECSPSVGIGEQEKLWLILTIQNVKRKKKSTAKLLRLLHCLHSPSNPVLKICRRRRHFNYQEKLCLSKWWSPSPLMLFGSSAWVYYSVTTTRGMNTKQARPRLIQNKAEALNLWKQPHGNRTYWSTSAWYSLRTDYVC